MKLASGSSQYANPSRVSHFALLTFVQDMLDRYTALLEEHANLKNDYASERDIRRNYQRSVDQMQRQVAETHRELVRCPPALSLVCATTANEYGRNTTRSS